MRKFWDRLTKAQKYSVAAGLAAVAAGLFIQFAIFPFYDAKEKVENSLAINEKTLKALEPLGREYRKWKQGSDAIREIAARRPPDFTLFTHLERKAADAGVRPAVRYINPLKATRVGELEETAVEIKLEKITLNQLTRFLYLVESPEDLVNVRKAAISKAKENPEFLNAVLQVVTYRQAQDAGPSDR